MQRRLVHLRSAEDSRTLSRRLARPVEDDNFRGFAAMAPLPSEATLHLLRSSLARAPVRVVAGARGVALVGDLFSLFAAGRELKEREERVAAELGEWIEHAAAAIDGPPAPLPLGGRRLDWTRPVVMGIVNVTPDSFSDGGRFLTPDAAIAHGLELAAEGADILDVGGESTRPRGQTYGAGASEVPADEEIARVVPVLRGLEARTDVPLSVDTRKSIVAQAALDAGATMVNDITGLLHDPALAQVVSTAGVPLCLMHTPADVESLAHEAPSEDVLGEVLNGLTRSIDAATAAGVERARLIVDPGIGFGKTVAGNLLLLHHLEAIAALGLPVLVGASRKSSIARAGSGTGEALPLGERLFASVGAAVAAYLGGAHLLRVHDVRATIEALRVAQAIRTALD